MHMHAKAYENLEKNFFTIPRATPQHVLPAASRTERSNVEAPKATMKDAHAVCPFAPEEVPPAWLAPRPHIVGSHCCAEDSLDGPPRLGQREWAATAARATKGAL